jgi:hypothetical protein
MKAAKSGWVVAGLVLGVLVLAASPARADRVRWSVGYTAPAASYVPRPLPWRQAPVPVSPVRQAYRAGYRDGYADGFHDGITAPVVVRRTVVSYAPVHSYRVIRWGSAPVCYGPSGGSFFTIRW